MSLAHIIILAIVQGLTEFLPISSSAHLILTPIVFGWPDQGLAFDVATHIGTLVAILWYFRADLGELWQGFWRSVLHRELTTSGRLAWAVLLGTIPVGLAGLAFETIIATQLRSPLIIATTTVVFGAALWTADYFGRRARDEHSLSWRDVALIGIAQAIALIPGTSRSGITMTAGLALGLNRVAAARFSFLLSIPVTALAGLLETEKLIRQSVPVNWTELALGALFSGIAAYLCVRLLVDWLQRHGMLPFVLYRFALGAVLLFLFI